MDKSKSSAKGLSTLQNAFMSLINFDKTCHTSTAVGSDVSMGFNVLRPRRTGDFAEDVGASLADVSPAALPLFRAGI